MIKKRRIFFNSNDHNENVDTNHTLSKTFSRREHRKNKLTNRNNIKIFQFYCPITYYLLSTL